MKRYLSFKARGLTEGGLVLVGRPVAPGGSTPPYSSPVHIREVFVNITNCVFDSKTKSRPLGEMPMVVALLLKPCGRSLLRSLTSSPR